ncbi:TlpA family protein disulfide reductase [Fodinibius halophilus]|uniref:TlpA family protein disulfide reductase n=1 Tax=Fodinibius halophilus TaxID=1736908 RepID=A0A6M1TFB9_9BACT|nr:TlpA disulfide reductase family protein [Fodinibius halophilus]NGP88852.1 TlpA family protein disulfide reductase [Fodinibius halophilus]
MRYLNSTILITIFLLCSFQLKAQKATEVDSSFQSKIDEAWAEIRDNNSDSLQNKYANQFYNYYKEHPQTKTGKEAIKSAFMMWGNTGAAVKADQALQHISYDSKLWSAIINSVSNAYHRSDEREWETDFVDLAHKLINNIPDPKSKSAILMKLADFHLYKKHHEKAEKLYKKIINLEGSEFYVNNAKGNLHEINNLGVEKKAPDFTASTLNGDKFTLSEETEKVVLLEFWATWCGPCKPQIPHLKKLHKKYPEEELQIVGIALNKNTDTLQEFIDNESMNWPQIQQEKKWKGKVAKLYNANRIPRTFIIDENGNIVAKDLRSEKLEEKISAVIKAK